MSANFFTIYEQSNIISSFFESNISFNQILNCRLRISMISLITVSRIFDRVGQYNMKCSIVSSLLPHNRHILLFSPFLKDVGLKYVSSSLVLNLVGILFTSLEELQLILKQRMNFSRSIFIGCYVL